MTIVDPAAGLVYYVEHSGESSLFLEAEVWRGGEQVATALRYSDGEWSAHRIADPGIISVAFSLFDAVEMCLEP